MKEIGDQMEFTHRFQLPTETQEINQFKVIRNFKLINGSFQREIASEINNSDVYLKKFKYSCFNSVKNSTSYSIKHR